MEAYNLLCLLYMQIQLYGKYLEQGGQWREALAGGITPVVDLFNFKTADRDNMDRVIRNSYSSAIWAAPDAQVSNLEGGMGRRMVRLCTAILIHVGGWVVGWVGGWMGRPKG